jgi:serine/threonine protein kinase
MGEIVAGRTTKGDYLFVRPLGSGSFASVWEAMHTKLSLQVAIKVMAKSSLDDDGARTRFAREVSIMKQIQHPFVVQFFELIEDASAYYVVMEYAAHGSVIDLVERNGLLPEARAREYFCELVFVLDYLHHAKMIAHRDLKAENILLDRHDHIRVIDFGLSAQFSSNDETMKTPCGSLQYAAPEVLKGHLYTRAADVWSAGVFLFVMTTGALPWPSTTQHSLVHNILGSDPTFPASMSPQLIDLLKKLLTRDPERRIDIENVKGHPWFSATEYADLVNHYSGNNCSGNDLHSDKEIISKLAALDVDITALHEQLLSRESTNLTAMYHELVRDIQTDRMHEFVRQIRISRSSPDSRHFGVSLAGWRGHRVEFKPTVIPRIGNFMKPCVIGKAITSDMSPRVRISPRKVRSLLPRVQSRSAGPTVGEDAGYPHVPG